MLLTTDQMVGAHHKQVPSSNPEESVPQQVEYLESCKLLRPILLSEALNAFSATFMYTFASTPTISGAALLAPNGTVNLT